MLIEAHLLQEFTWIFYPLSIVEPPGLQYPMVGYFAEALRPWISLSAMM